MDFIEIYNAFFEKRQQGISKESLNNCFKLPIEYLDDKKKISENIINDLELKELKSDIVDTSNNIKYKKNLYYSVLNPETLFEKQIIDKWSNYYTNDKEYLQDTQKLLKNFKNCVTIKENFDIYNGADFKDSDNLKDSKNLNNLDNIIYNNYENIIYDNGFIEKYQYFDLPFLNKFNSDPKALTFLSIYNLSSPLISLLLPIISLIIPFLIIKLQGYDITTELYFLHLKNTFKDQAIGQIFYGFSDQPISSKIYIILSIFFYFFQIYQNIFSCIRYFTNIEHIHNILFQLRSYLKNTIGNMKNLIGYTENFNSYKDFNNTVKERLLTITNYYSKLENINNYKVNFKKFLELGNIMKCFYMLNNDKELIETLYYSFNFNGYLRNINSIQKLIKNYNFNFCKFNENNEKSSFKNSYFGFLLMDRENSSKIIKNTYDLSNNMILTGPNAAGKTTILKSTLFNIILSQQIGCGFYEDANLEIYDHIHCYLNIPDTSNRDSLFQAEARQCKEILETIENNKTEKHFCVFDELYSGTNPDEAIESGYNYLKFLNKNKKVNYVLTTHYHKLCKKMDKTEKNIKNYHMEIIENTTDFDFTYRLKKGISKVRGGIKVLKDMEYPEEIINTDNTDRTNKTIKNNKKQ